MTELCPLPEAVAAMLSDGESVAPTRSGQED